MTRRLRVLADHPHLGRPNDVRTEFEGAQAYVDAGYAEWIGERSAVVETAERPGPPEDAAARPSARRAARERTTK